MIDREGRVVFGSLLAFVLAVSVSVVLERQAGMTVRESPLVVFVLVVGVAIGFPQLYLAWTGTGTERGTRSRTRLRFVAVTTAVFAVAFAHETAGTRYVLLAVVGIGALVALLCYEALSGYRAASDDISFDFLNR